MVPKIPGELLVNFFMHKKEGNNLGVGEDSTEKWRKENNIPDSDGLALMMEDQQKRGRSDTVSTTLSNSHDAKGAKLIGIPEEIFCTIMWCNRHQKFNVICRFEPVCAKFHMRAVDQYREKSTGIFCKRQCMHSDDKYSHPHPPLSQCQSGAMNQTSINRKADPALVM